MPVLMGSPGRQIADEHAHRDGLAHAGESIPVLFFASRPTPRHPAAHLPIRAIIYTSNNFQPLF